MTVFASISKYYLEKVMKQNIHKDSKTYIHPQKNSYSPLFFGTLVKIYICLYIRICIYIHEVVISVN